jgi:transposase
MARRNPVSDDVLIAVDPHKASNTAAVLDPVSKTVIEAAWFANTIDGYAQLTAFAARWSQRRWAVEGCHGAGRSLAQRLAADGEAVLDVPAKLAARVRVYSRGHGRKTDKGDAVSVGLAALDGTGVVPVAADGATSACGCCVTGARSSRRCAPRRCAGCIGCWPSSPRAGCAAS